MRRLLDLGHEVVALDYKEGLKTQELREWGAEVVLGSVTDGRSSAAPWRGSRWCTTWPPRSAR